MLGQVNGFIEAALSVWALGTRVSIASTAYALRVSACLPVRTKVSAVLLWRCLVCRRREASECRT